MDDKEKLDYSEYTNARSESKMTPYQRRVAKVENVILCVAEAEKMVGSVGQTLLDDTDNPEESVPTPDKE